MRTSSRSPRAPVALPRPGHGGSGIRPRLFYGTFAALLGTNILTLVGFLMAPDIAAIIGGEQERVLVAYEDRIAELRVEVDRLYSRQYAQAGNLNLQLQELTQQQEILLEQHHYVRQLADKASDLGLVTAVSDPPVPAKRRDAALSGDATQAGSIEAAALELQEMLQDNRLALAAIATAATTSADEILGQLAEVGIRPDVPPLAAVGGPYLPPRHGADAPTLVDDANAAMAALARFKAARGALDLAPVHQPLASTRRISSNFGNREDPFGGGRAFHAGMDFPAATGTAVLSAGHGTVTFVGRRSGYGKVVEITHAEGLVTRYAHLSAYLVKSGQVVGAGVPIARVGSTGRSTGPHLHFEVRREDRPVDPGRYLAAGRHLKRYLDS